MSEYSLKNRELIKKNFKYDVWIDERMKIQNDKMISVSNWCIECLKEDIYAEAQIVYRGNSLCLNHGKIKIGEDSE